jgi:hypothetical protein
MGTVFSTVIVLAYFIVVFVLPIRTASDLVQRLTGSWKWSDVIVVASLIGGVLGFVCDVTWVARVTPPGHDLFNAWGLAAAIFTGMLIGLPLGTWSGAWGSALLILWRGRARANDTSNSQR